MATDAIPKGAEAPKVERETVSTRSADPGWVFIHRSDGELRGAIWFGTVVWYRSAADELYQTKVAMSGDTGFELIGCSAAEFRDAYSLAVRAHNSQTETARKVKHLLSQREAAKKK